MNRFGLIRRASFLVAFSALAVACGASSGGDASESASPEPPADTVDDTPSEPDGTGLEPSETDVTEVPQEAAPRCAITQDDGSFLDIDCAEPHDAEFAGLVNAPSGTAPEPPAPTEGEPPNVFPDLELHRTCLESAEQLTGRSGPDGGVGVGYVSSAEPGEAYAGEIECWALVQAEETLIGSMQGVGLQAVLGDRVLLFDVDPGTCFRYGDPEADSFEVIEVIACSEATGDVTAEQLVGVVELADRQFPGTDGLADEAFPLCDVAAADLVVQPLSDDLAVITPLEPTWQVNGERSAYCVALVLAGDEAADATLCATIADGGFEERSCGEPHNAEFAGAVEPPPGTLPTDPIEADIFLTRLCAPVVAEFAGASPSEPGLGTAFSVDLGLGDELVDPIDCYATVSAVEGLIASIADVGLDAARSDDVILASLEPGTCFVFAAGTFEFGTVVSCDTPDALMAIGSFEADDGPYPGEDELRVVRGERCRALLGETTLSVDESTVSGTIPTRVEWEGLGQRNVTCDATPA
jgi:hypothetical protein